MKKNLNQKLISLIEYYNLINNNLFISNTPVKRNINNNYNFKGNKIEKLEKLKKMIINIKNCQLKKSANKIVFGAGNINSKIMIIGEGPGAQEDIEGVPFVGRAGKLLDKMLKAINLDRKKIYISNVVNYRPPENRKPTDEEIKRYYPYVITHIEIINPKILVLLGSTALNTILEPEEVISKIRGQWIKKQIGKIEPWIIASFHPSFLLRQPEQKKLSWIDLKLIKNKINELGI